MELNFPRAPKPIQKRPLWKSAAVALISLFVVLVVFFLWTHPSISCDLRGGKWFYPATSIELNEEGNWYHKILDYGLWMDPAGFCIYIYADGGQPCTSECQGGCVRNRCANDSVEIMQMQRIHFQHGRWEVAP